MKAVRELINSLLNAIFPNRCVACGEIIPEGESFCDYCFEMLPKTADDKLCKICGCKKENCQCRYHVFHFSGSAAPFYTENPAKEAMYAFKFRRKYYVGDFFAKQMALCVKTKFHGIEFDGIVYVPMPLKRQLRRGYNQSRELAVKIAEILNIPLLENALGCNGKKKTQHKTHIKERFKNVKGMFYPNMSLRGRTVLLVDDIKTTGATLDECAKELLRAGADDVYCITGTVTRYIKDKKDRR